MKVNQKKSIMCSLSGSCVSYKEFNRLDTESKYEWALKNGFGNVPARSIINLYSSVINEYRYYDDACEHIREITDRYGDTLLDVLESIDEFSDWMDF